LTKIETFSLFVRRFAKRQSRMALTECALVGISETVAFMARKPSTARLNAGSVRAIMGRGGIGIWFLCGRGGRVRRFGLVEAQAIKPRAAAQTVKRIVFSELGEFRSWNRFTDSAERMNDSL